MIDHLHVRLEDIVEQHPMEGRHGGVGAQQVDQDVEKTQ